MRAAGVVWILAAVVLAAAIAEAGIAGDAAQSSRWQMTQLQTPRGWDGCSASQLNEQGLVLGECTRAGWTHPFVWPAGVPTPVGALSIRAKFEASGLNDRGQVVGSRWTKVSPAHAEPVDQRAFVWEDGRLTDLGPGWASAINNHGQIVGAAMPGFPDDYIRRAALWQNGQRILLAPAGTRSYAVAVNERGQVAFSTETSGSAERPWIWKEGKSTPIGRRGLSAEAISDRGEVVGFCQFMEISGSSPCGAFLWQSGTTTIIRTLDAYWPHPINDLGQIAGSDTPGTRVHARLWKGGRLLDLGTLPGTNLSRAYALNNRGQVVGVSGNQKTEPEGQWAFVWQRGAMSRLPAPSGTRNTRAAAINERGQIAGTVTDRAGGAHAVIWEMR